MTTVTPGIYEHYKGGRYRVLGVAAHTETDEQLVVYRSLETERLLVRPLQMFLETVTVDGKDVPRFRFVGV